MNFICKMHSIPNRHTIMKNKALLLYLLTAMSQTAFASETTDEIALLRQQIQMLTERLDKIENQSNQKVVVKTTVPKAQGITKQTAKSTGSENNKTHWYEKMSLHADLRDRFEYIDQRGKATRIRNRVRFRMGGEYQVNNDVKIGFGLASGLDEPTSTNQTLGDAFSTKDIRLDLAYFSWDVNDTITLTGGKMKNPLYRPGKNPALWDNDLNPEGFSLTLDNGFLQGVFIGYSVEEIKADDDILLFGGQVRHAFILPDSAKLIAGVGYYDYQNLQGHKPLADGKAHGNTLDANGNIANDFNTIEAFLEYKTKLANQPFSVYGNFYRNTEANVLDTAYTVGFTYGKIKDFRSWSL
ncbi:MAG: putative porin, partial [Alcanivoracaceae bacterium]|nr:putative porin [Alcanivoracaceae bacterium]